MKAILIVYLSFHIDGGAVATQTEFKSMEHCQAVRTALVAAHLDDPNRRAGYRNITAMCVKG